jgi:hypothetical protein
VGADDAAGAVADVSKIVNVCGGDASAVAEQGSDPQQNMCCRRGCSGWMTMMVQDDAHIRGGGSSVWKTHCRREN